MNIRSTTLLSLLLIGGAAHAEGVYVLAAIGQSHFHQDTSRADKDAYLEDLGAIVDSSTQDRDDTGYKLQVGYQFNANFALEAGYVDLGQQEYSADLNNGTATTKEETSAKGLNVAALLTLPINAGFSAFLKLGVINAEVKEKVSASSSIASASDSETAKKVRPNFGIGVAYNFYRGLSARAEVERFSKLGDKDKTGDELDVNFYSLGLSYQF